MSTEAFKKGKTSGNYSTHKEQDGMEKKNREMAKNRAIKNTLNKHAWSSGKIECNMCNKTTPHKHFK